MCIVASVLFLSACNGGGANPEKGGTWGTAELIETNSGTNATNPQIAIEVGDNAIVVWDQGDAHVWFNRYTEGTGWGTAEVVPGSDNGWMSRIATDRNGHVIVVWQRTEGFTSLIWANRYIVGTGWGVAELVSTDNTVDSNSPEIAADKNGNAVVVWRQAGTMGANQLIGANQYDPVNGWGTASVISDSNEIADAPQVAFGGNGEALVVWYQSDGTHQTIRSKRYSTNNGWDTTDIVLDNALAMTGGPQIAMNGRGTAIAVWHKSETDNVTLSINVWAKRYAPGTGWGPAIMISDNTGFAFPARVAIDTNGSAVALWRHFNGTNYEIWANRYAEGLGWGTAVMIGPTSAGDAFPSQVAMDSDGNAFAVWMQIFPGTMHAWVNRYRKDIGWGTASFLDTNDAIKGSNPRIAMDDIGNAITVWDQHTEFGVNDIWANRYLRKAS